MLDGGERGEELTDFAFAHGAGMTLVVEKDESLDPVEVGFLGLWGEVTQLHGFAGGIEEFWRGRMNAVRPIRRGHSVKPGGLCGDHGIGSVNPAVSGTIHPLLLPVHGPISEIQFYLIRG